MDQSKKTMRHFYCRDVLWETFEQMANDFDCSIDYLVNEAMRYYARSKNYQSPGGPAMTQGAPVAPPNNTAAPTSYPGKPPVNGARQPPTSPPQQQIGNGPRRPQPPTPSAYQGANNNVMARGQTSAAPNGMHGGQPSAHAPAPTNSLPGNPGNMGGPPPSNSGSGPTLFLLYNGQRYPVTKDQFIIGRGSKTSDLPIKDGNISRKHAAVIRRNGTFYIKDLGSTNGIDYKGMRIDNKRIDEGDVFHLCDYELRFTYRAD